MNDSYFGELKMEDNGLRKYFPEVKFEYGALKQMYRVLDELVEAEEAHLNNDREHFLEEMVDVLHTAANVLYKSGYSNSEITDKIYAVQDKNRARDKYK